MAKTKTPFFGLGSQGTIGDALTTQKRGQETIFREKPIPAYRRTLPQLYQRWLYEDYAYLWRQQSEATQAEYRSAGVRHHLTGFQYWMKYNLLNLPDFEGWWKLDERAGAIAYDSSKTANHGTIIGASLDTGRINGARFFDALNDRIALSRPLTGSYGTMLAWLKCSLVDADVIIANCPSVGVVPYFQIMGHENQVAVYRSVTGVCAKGTFNISDNQWHRIVVQSTGTEYLFSVDGQPDPISVGPANDGVWFDDWGGDVGAIGVNWRAGPWAWLSGSLDDIQLKSRVLDANEIERDAERRYP